LGTEIRCKECRHILFEIDGVPTDVIWYSRLRHKLGGKCPNCGHKLPSISKYAKRIQLEVKSAVPVIAK
jgi:DNA-directed RNA polymerase subunit RPC12/RpoP